MKVLLTRALHEPNGDEIAAGTEVDLADGEQLIALGGALPIVEEPAVTPVKKSTKLRSE